MPVDPSARLALNTSNQASDNRAVRVSVIMPAFNAEPFIAAALASAQAQTETDIEILVINDCSTDRTVEIVQTLGEADSRIRLFNMPVNSGPAAARNRGFSLARGKWIALLDADDGFHPRRLEQLLALAESKGADVVSDNLLLCPVDEPAVPMIPVERMGPPRHLSPAEFVNGNIGSRKTPRVSYGFMQPVFKRAFLERHHIAYNEQNRFGEDYLLALNCLVRGAQWWMTPEPMYHYTIRKGSLTEAQSSQDLMRIRSEERRLLADPRVAGDKMLVRAIKQHKTIIDRCYYYRAFTDAVKAGQFPLAATIFFESPLSVRLIAQESLAQAPLIMGKAMRGGYRSSKPASRKAAQAVF
jgi:glycosyltransferase involved in cell wall biosynthesis